MRILYLVFALLLAALPARAQTAEQAIRGVIDSQLDAFAADDFATAFGFASDPLQRFFVSPENFRQMVENGYQMVIRPRDVRYGSAEPEGGYVWQKVFITDSSGALYTLRYQMIPTSEGPRINAVEIIPGHELAA